MTQSAIQILASYNINAICLKRKAVNGWAWKVASPLLPEFFTLLAINLFQLLSMLTCLLEERLPKPIPYIYQIAALAGYANMLISRSFLAVFDEHMRFWYCFIYLLVALANIVMINVYLAVSRKLWSLSKVWASAVTFPTVLISMFFVSQYSVVMGTELPLLVLQVGLVVSAMLMGVCISIFLSPDLFRRLIPHRRR